MKLRVHQRLQSVSNRFEWNGTCSHDDCRQPFRQGWRRHRQKTNINGNAINLVQQSSRNIKWHINAYGNSAKGKAVNYLIYFGSEGEFKSQTKRCKKRERRRRTFKVAILLNESCAEKVQTARMNYHHDMKHIIRLVRLECGVLLNRRTLTDTEWPGRDRVEPEPKFETKTEKFI